MYPIWFIINMSEYTLKLPIDFIISQNVKNANQYQSAIAINYLDRIVEMDSNSCNLEFEMKYDKILKEKENLHIDYKNQIKNIKNQMEIKKKNLIDSYKRQLQDYNKKEDRIKKEYEKDINEIIEKYKQREIKIKIDFDKQIENEVKSKTIMNENKISELQNSISLLTKSKIENEQIINNSNNHQMKLEIEKAINKTKNEIYELQKENEKLSNKIIQIKNEYESKMKINIKEAIQKRDDEIHQLKIKSQSELSNLEKTHLNSIIEIKNQHNKDVNRIRNEYVSKIEERDKNIQNILSLAKNQIDDIHDNIISRKMSSRDLGELGENEVYNYLSNKYNVIFQRKTGHRGDMYINYQNLMKIMIEVKNKNYIKRKEDIDKFYSDIKNNDDYNGAILYANGIDIKGFPSKLKFEVINNKPIIFLNDKMDKIPMIIELISKFIIDFKNLASKQMKQGEYIEKIKNHQRIFKSQIKLLKSIISTIQKQRELWEIECIKIEESINTIENEIKTGMNEIQNDLIESISKHAIGLKIGLKKLTIKELTKSKDFTIEHIKQVGGIVKIKNYIKMKR